MQSQELPPLPGALMQWRRLMPSNVVVQGQEPAGEARWSLFSAITGYAAYVHTALPAEQSHSSLSGQSLEYHGSQ